VYIVALGVDGGATVQKELHGVEAAPPCRDVKRREALRCALGAGVEGVGLRGWG